MHIENDDIVIALSPLTGYVCDEKYLKYFPMYLYLNTFALKGICKCI